MDDKDAPETYITDSNVDITISNGTTQKVDEESKKSEPWAMIFVAVILVALAAYGFLMRAKLL